MRNRKILQWDNWGCGMVWSALFLLLLLFFLLHSVQGQGLSSVVAMFSRPDPPVTIVARTDLPAFTLLTLDKIALLQGGVERNPSSQDTDALKQQERLYNRHITLHPYRQGEEIRLGDIGPPLSTPYQYQVREINAHITLDWVQVGDTLSFMLIDTSCTMNGVAGTNAACSAHSNANPLLLKDTVVIEIEQTAQGEQRVLLVAIPLEENASALALLDTGQEHIIAYPVATTASMSTARSFFIV
ncbi:MAG TPA: hypothetical protein VFV38_40060 [Ktedonobacteraceae bacterium]|nr:hypothetical protein [Ktedonobacteraceae bacterium]